MGYHRMHGRLRPLLDQGTKELAVQGEWKDAVGQREASICPFELVPVIRRSMVVSRNTLLSAPLQHLCYCHFAHAVFLTVGAIRAENGDEPVASAIASFDGYSLACQLKHARVSTNLGQSKNVAKRPAQSGVDV